MIFSELTLNKRGPSIYQARDIYRSYDILNGHFTWFGSELSGGGNTPGPAYYWLMAAPLWVTGSWHSLYLYSYLLAALALVLLWYFLKNNFSERAGFFFVFLFLNSSLLLFSF